MNACKFCNDKTDKRSLPAIYCAATWRNTTPVDDRFLEMGIGFDLADGSTIRLRLSVEHAKHVSETIAEYLRHHAMRIHSDTSSGMPAAELASLDNREMVLDPATADAIRQAQRSTVCAVCGHLRTDASAVRLETMPTPSSNARGEAVGAAELKLTCDISPFQSELALLEKAFHLAPEVVERFLCGVNPLAQLVRFDAGDGAALAAGECRVVLQPSDFLRHFVAAVLAGDVEGL